MKRDIILSGVGGQGILSIAAVIGRAALEDGLHIKQAEVHGMSQRGGDVHQARVVADKGFTGGNQNNRLLELRFPGQVSAPGLLLGAERGENFIARLVIFR